MPVKIGKGIIISTVSNYTPPYKIYKGFITQSGTNDPQVVILENTLGGSAPVIAYSSVGSYTISHASFVYGYTFSYISNIDDANNDASVLGFNTIKHDSGTTVRINTYNNSVDVPVLANGILFDTPFYIEVYP